MENFRGSDDNQPVNPWSNNIDSSLEQADNVNPDMPPAPYPEASSTPSIAEFVDETKEVSKKSLRTKVIATIGGIALVTTGVAVWLGSNSSDNNNNHAGTTTSIESTHTNENSTPDSSESIESSDNSIDSNTTSSEFQPEEGDITMELLAEEHGSLFGDNKYDNISDYIKNDPENLCKSIKLLPDYYDIGEIENCYVIGAENPDNISIQFDTYIEASDSRDNTYYRTIINSNGEVTLIYTGDFDPVAMIDEDEATDEWKSHVTPITTDFIPSKERSIELYNTVGDMREYSNL